MYPMHRGLRRIGDNQQFNLDPTAVVQLSTLGTGWDVLQSSHPAAMNLALRAVQLTVALDQSCRAGQGYLPLHQISLLTTVLQHDLLLLKPSEAAADIGLGHEDHIGNICRLALQIY